MNISILLRHSGVWENDGEYKSYFSDDIVIGDNVSFVNLKAAIAAELRIDDSRKKMLTRYIAEENSSPITICSDISVQLYIEIKKRNQGLERIHYV